MDELDDLIDAIPTHFLVELTSLDELAFPANSTKRVKYTCVASTSKSLCLGTSTGSVYIFSRYAAKSRSRANSPVPVQVFTTRDGQISTISISQSEELMAIGGDSGRVSVAQLNNGQPPTLIYSTPGDARSPDKVTALTWSSDLKTLYSGHLSGSLHCHRLTSRSVFRAAHQKLAKFEGEVTQLDILHEHVLVATTFAAHLIHVESGTVQQVGKKSRTSPASLGAIYITPESGSAFIAAARPNGRLWEANLMGVVYRTHQYRQNPKTPRAPPVSFRHAFHVDPICLRNAQPENQDVSLTKLAVLKLQSISVIVSAQQNSIVLVEMDTSRVICVSEMDHEILDFSTCGNDIFVLFSDSKGLRKYSVFDRTKTVEKMNSKGFFVQAAQFLVYNHSFAARKLDFPNDLLEKTVEGLAMMSKKKETEKLQGLIEKMLEDRRIQQSMYDNMEEKQEKRAEISKKLPSGVHRVLQTAQSSGYDDDFCFSTPQALRERSRSSPCSPESPDRGQLTKRASEPTNLEIFRKNGTPDVAEEDILNRARQILEKTDADADVESLRTLLQLEGVQKDEIRFTPTVTIGNAAKALAELALAVPMDLSTIWREKSKKMEEKPKKPTIVKVVRPGVRKPVATVSPRNANPEISEEMRRKQDEMWLELRLESMKKKSDTPEHSEVYRNPLPESPMTSSNCKYCKLHRSWAAAALLFAVTGKGEVLQDDLPRGSVPKSLADWQKVLCHVASATITPTSISLCPRCETAMSSVERTCNDTWKSIGGVVEDGTRPNCERIFERTVVSTDKEKLLAIVRPKSGEKKTLPTSHDTMISDLPEVLETSEVFGQFPWVPLRNLLALAVFCVGKKALLQIIAADDKFIAKRMIPEDWAAIVVAGARESGHKDILAEKTILSVLESVNAAGWIVVRKSAKKPTSTTIGSWIVDTNGKCPICTLPIKMIVGGTDRGLVSHCCGHVYHKMCLQGRISVGCLACRARAKRAAAVTPKNRQFT